MAIIIENILLEVRERLGSVNVFVNWKATEESREIDTSGDISRNSCLSNDNFSNKCSKFIADSDNADICNREQIIANTYISSRFDKKNNPVIEILDRKCFRIKLSSDIGNQLNLNSTLTVMLDIGNYFGFNGAKYNNFRWEKKSLSLFSYQLSFRASIENIQDNKWINYGEINLCPTTFELNKPLIKAKETKNIIWSCRNCLNSISNTVPFYERVQSYPQGFIDTDNFFCHQHSKKASDNSSGELNDALKPKPNDLFYGYDYLIVHRSHMKDLVNVKDLVICCFHCNETIGVLLNSSNSETFKIWSDAVLINSLNESLSFQNLEVFPLYNHPTLNKPVYYLLTLVRDIIKTNLSLPIKLLLKEDTRNQYLFLYIFEHDLKVLKEGTMNLKQESSEDSEIQNVTLEPFLAIRLLYKVILQVQSSHKYFITSWQQDFLTMEVSISPFLMLNLINELETNNKVIPSPYRVVELHHESWLTSYIFYK